jgi:putative transposase
VKINGELCYLWRAVDHESEVLETVATAKRDEAAALKFLKRIMKKYGRPENVVIDGLCSYPAAMREIGNADRRRLGAASTIGRRIRISRFDDENGPCSGFETRRRYRN